MCTGLLQLQGLMNLELTFKYFRYGALLNRSVFMAYKKGVKFRSGILLIRSSFLKNRMGSSLLHNLQRTPDWSSISTRPLWIFFAFLYLLRRLRGISPLTLLPIEKLDSLSESP